MLYQTMASDLFHGDLGFGCGAICSMCKEYNKVTHELQCNVYICQQKISNKQVIHWILQLKETLESRESNPHIL